MQGGDHEECAIWGGTLVGDLVEGLMDCKDRGSDVQQTCLGSLLVMPVCFCRTEYRLVEDGDRSCRKTASGEDGVRFCCWR